MIVWLMVGGLVGWIASLLVRTDAPQGVFLNVVVGSSGAFLAGLLVSPFSGVSTLNQSNFGMRSLVVSLVGAVALLAIAHLVRRGVAR